MVRMLSACAVIGLFLAMAAPGRCAEIILPQGRSAFYADEAIELAVAGLDRGQSATIALVPQGKIGGAGATRGPVEGDGSTVVVVLPPLFLAPGVYEVALDGKPARGPADRLGRRERFDDADHPDDRGLTGCGRPAGTSCSATPSSSGWSARTACRRRTRGADRAAWTIFDQAVAARPADGRVHVLDRLRDPQALGHPQGLGRVDDGPDHADVQPARRPAAAAVPAEHRRASARSTSRGSARGRRRPAAGPRDSPTGTRGPGTRPAAGRSPTTRPPAPTTHWRRYATIRGGIIGERQAEAHADIKRVWPDVDLQRRQLRRLRRDGRRRPDEPADQRHPGHPRLPRLGHRPAGHAQRASTSRSRTTRRPTSPWR